MWRRILRLPKRLQIIYSLIALVICVGIAIFFWAIASGKITPFAAPGEAALSLQSDSSTYNPGVSFTVYVNLDTGGSEVSEVGIRSLSFDPAVLDVIDQDQNLDGVQITPGLLGSLNPTENSVDTLSGKITYVAQGTSFSGSGRVATVNFTAKAAGSSTLTFDFSAGTIGDTDVIAASGGNDILTSAAPMTITVAGSESHTICNTSSQTCETVSGAGANQCSSDTDCQASSDYHYICYAPKKVCLKKSGPGSNECVSYSDCLKPSPTPPGPSPTPTPTQIQPTATPTGVSILLTPTPTSEIINSPTPEEIFSPSELPSPEVSPETKVAGFGISLTWALILFIGIPAVITIAIFLIWRWRKKKAGEFTTPSENDENLDDDEMI